MPPQRRAQSARERHTEPAARPGMVRVNPSLRQFLQAVKGGQLVLIQPGVAPPTGSLPEPEPEPELEPEPEPRPAEQAVPDHRSRPSLGRDAAAAGPGVLPVPRPPAVAPRRRGKLVGYAPIQVEIGHLGGATATLVVAEGTSRASRMFQVAARPQSVVGPSDGARGWGSDTLDELAYWQAREPQLGVMLVPASVRGLDGPGAKAAAEATIRSVYEDSRRIDKADQEFGKLTGMVAKIDGVRAEVDGEALAADPWLHRMANHHHQQRQQEDRALAVAVERSWEGAHPRKPVQLSAKPESAAPQRSKMTLRERQTADMQKWRNSRNAAAQAAPAKCTSWSVRGTGSATELPPQRPGSVATLNRRLNNRPSTSESQRPHSARVDSGFFGGAAIPGYSHAMVAGVLNPLTGQCEQEFHKGKMADELLTQAGGGSGRGLSRNSIVSETPAFHRYVPPIKRVTGLWWLQKMDDELKTMGRKIVGSQLIPDDRKESPMWEVEKKKLNKALAPPKPIVPATRKIKTIKTQDNTETKPENSKHEPEVEAWQPEENEPEPQNTPPKLVVIEAPAPEPARAPVPVPVPVVIREPEPPEVMSESDDDSIALSDISENAINLGGTGTGTVNVNTLKELLDSYPPSQGNRMRNHLVHAAAHYGSGCYKDAIKWLDAAMDVDAEETLTPTDLRLEFAVLLTCRGILMRKLGMLDSAFDNLQAAKEKYKLKEQWHHTSHGHLQRGSIRAALSELTEATVKFPECGIAHRLMGDIVRQEEADILQANTEKLQDALEPSVVSYSAAIACFVAELGSKNAGNPNDPTKATLQLEAYLQHCHMWRGVSNTLLQRPDLAIEDFQALVEYGEHSRDLLVRLGDCYVATHQFGTAWKTFNDVVERYPKCAMAYCQRGRAVFMNGFPSYALKDLNKANKLDQGDPLPLYYRACLRYTDKPLDADQDFSAALRVDQNNAHMLAARGVLREAIDRENFALKDYARAVELQPNLVHTHVNLGFLRLRQNPPDTEGALSCAESAIKHESNHAKAWVCKGEALRRMSWLTEAQRAFAKALHADPNCAIAFFCRGFMLAEMDENRLALYDLLSFLRCGNTDASARLMGQAYLLLDQHELAAVKFRKDLDKLESSTGNRNDAGGDPDDGAAESLRLLGEAFRGQGMLIDAQGFFDSAVLKAPKTALMYISRGRCCLDMEQKGMRPEGVPDKPSKKEKSQNCGPYGATALKDFNKAVSLDRTSALCWNELGIARRRLKQEGRGFAEFTTSISCDLRYVAALVNRAPLHAAMGNSHLALYDYTRAIEYDKNHITAYVNRGVLQFTLGSFAMAIADFDHALRLEPRCSVAWYNRGVCYQSLKKWDQAVQDYTKALASSPANFRVLRNRALAHLHGTKRADLARSDFVRILQQQPTSSELLCGLGLCEHRLKNSQEAIHYYAKALDCDTNCAAALLGRGNVYLEQIGSGSGGSIAIANAKNLCMADYQRAIHIYPNYVPAHVNMALALHESDRDADAWHVFTSALSMDPINPTALEGRAASSQVLENEFGAYLDMSAAITMEPKNARLLTTHGFIAQILNDVHVATHSYMKAAQNDPSYGLAHYNLALMLRTRGDLQGAKEAYTKAIGCGVGQNADHYPVLNRGIVHMELGDLQAALADFSVVIKAEPKSVAGYINRARAYASSAMWQEAEADYNEAVSLTPLDADLYQERSDVCGAQHKAPDCLKNYGTFLCLADGILPAGNNESTTEISKARPQRKAKAINQHPLPPRLQRRR